MATPDDVLAIARGEIGYYAPDDPEPGSKYGRWMAEATGEDWLAGPSTSVWWCMIFVSWCFDQAGMQCDFLPSYNTDDCISRAHACGCLLDDVRQAQRGDIVIFNWDWDGATDHVGLVDYNNGANLQTVEGNTSGSAYGSQSAGNGVWPRTRGWESVAAVIRPPYDYGASETPTGPYRVDVDGWVGKETVTAMQILAGTTVDGIVSGQYEAWAENLYRLIAVDYDGGSGESELARWMQERSGNPTVDGILGEESVKCWQRYIGVEADGYFGPDTATATQRWVNEQLEASGY